MIAIIDTSSLLAFVRYYLPFDRNDTLKTLLCSKIENGEILVLDKIIDESKYQSQGIILKELGFLTEKKNHVNTSEFLPSRAFFNLLENQFCNKDIRKLKDITDSEFELEKTKFLNGADANLLLCALNLKSKNPVIVTEETINANDGKLFKKIPDNCKSVEISCCTLPVYFKDYLQIDFISAL
jgi:hypothetical protein